MKAPLMSSLQNSGMSRRDVMIGLVAIVPAARFVGSDSASAANGDIFLAVSQVITGSDALSAGIAQRIRGLLASRDKQFDTKLTGLSKTMTTAGGNRQDMLGKLSDAQVEFAIEIAKPWYLGYVGTPSNFVLKDDAAFATFMDVQSWQKIIDEVPRPTYPTGNAGWWSAAPPGVVVPDMPADIVDWTFHPGGPNQILAPDANWLSYGQAKHSNIEAARRAKPDAATNKGSN